MTLVIKITIIWNFGKERFREFSKGKIVFHMSNLFVCYLEVVWNPTLFLWLFYESWSIPTALVQVNRLEEVDSFLRSLIFSFPLPHYNAFILLRYSVFYFKVILCKEGPGVLLFHLNILLALCRSWYVCFNYHNSPPSYVTSQCKHSTQEKNPQNILTDSDCWKSDICVNHNVAEISPKCMIEGFFFFNSPQDK